MSSSEIYGVVIDKVPLYANESEKGKENIIFDEVEFWWYKKNGSAGEYVKGTSDEILKVEQNSYNSTYTPSVPVKDHNVRWCILKHDITDKTSNQSITDMAVLKIELGRYVVGAIIRSYLRINGEIQYDEEGNPKYADDVITIPRGFSTSNSIGKQTLWVNHKNNIKVFTIVLRNNALSTKNEYEHPITYIHENSKDSHLSQVNNSPYNRQYKQITEFSINSTGNNYQDCQISITPSYAKLWLGYEYNGLEEE